MDLLYKIQSFGHSFLELLDKQTTNRKSEILYSHIAKAYHFNHWYTEENVLLRLQQICKFLISEQFISTYSIILNNRFKKNRTIGFFSEENIPLEEFPVLLSILLSGNSFLYKTSEKSDKLISFFFELLGKTINDLKQGINFTDGMLKSADTLIITRLKESHSIIKKYLEKKKSFQEVRHQSVAILGGNEDDGTLKLLGKDIFSFYGQGCGNVRKIYIPKSFDLTIFFQAIEGWHSLSDHNTYANNYQYYQSVYLLNRIPHFDNGFLLFKEDKAMRSPTGVMYYEYYEDKSALLETLRHSSNVSVIYTSNPVHKREIMFGESVNQLLLPSENLINFLQ